MSENLGVKSAESESRETSRGLRTLGTTIGLDLLVGELTPEQVARVWNAHLASEGKETLALTGASRTRIAQSYTDFRRVLRDACRRHPERSRSLTFQTTGEMAVVGEGQATMPSMVEPVELAPKPAPVKLPRPLSPLEQRIFVVSAKGGNLPAAAPAETMLDAGIAEELARAADEAQAQSRLKSDYVLWVCTRADEILAGFQHKEGEGLWTNPILVESFPAYPSWKAVFVCSSTAPLVRNVASPTVKHDFRANEAPVTHSHPLAFKQADGMKVIRSKVIRKGAHEYYVKALNYQDGTFFKGYFVVDGQEDGQAVPPRYYQVQGNDVVTLTESGYLACQNRKAANKPLRLYPAGVLGPRGGGVRCIKGGVTTVDLDDDLKLLRALSAAPAPVALDLSAELDEQHNQRWRALYDVPETGFYVVRGFGIEYMAVFRVQFLRRVERPVHMRRPSRCWVTYRQIECIWKGPKAEDLRVVRGDKTIEVFAGAIESFVFSLRDALCLMHEARARFLRETRESIAHLEASIYSLQEQGLKQAARLAEIEAFDPEALLPAEELHLEELAAEDAMAKMHSDHEENP